MFAKFLLLSFGLFALGACSNSGSGGGALAHHRPLQAASKAAALPAVNEALLPGTWRLTRAAELDGDVSPYQLHVTATEIIKVSTDPSQNFRHGYTLNNDLLILDNGDSWQILLLAQDSLVVKDGNSGAVTYERISDTETLAKAPPSPKTPAPPPAHKPAPPHPAPPACQGSSKWSHAIGAACLIQGQYFYFAFSGTTLDSADDFRSLILAVRDSKGNEEGSVENPQVSGDETSLSVNYSEDFVLSGIILNEPLPYLTFDVQFNGNSGQCQIVSKGSAVSCWKELQKKIPGDGTVVLPVDSGK